MSIFIALIYSLIIRVSRPEEGPNTIAYDVSHYQPQIIGDKTILLPATTRTPSITILEPKRRQAPSIITPAIIIQDESNIPVINIEEKNDTEYKNRNSPVIASPSIIIEDEIETNPKVNVEIKLNEQVSIGENHSKNKKASEITIPSFSFSNH